MGSGANIYWGAMKSRPEFNPSSRVPTGPKPDLTYGFPIITSERNLPRGFYQETSAKNFSLDLHEQLCKSDLIGTTVTTGLQKKTRESLSAADLLCFPWAIVEVNVSTHERIPRGFATVKLQMLALQPFHFNFALKKHQEFLRIPIRSFHSPVLALT